jgi:hypothetical protein
VGRSPACKTLQARRRKERDNNNDKENGLRMRKKRFSFFQPARIKSEKLRILTSNETK